MFFTEWTWLKANLSSRIKSERGATAVEYGLMVALIAVVIIASVTLLGEALDEKFNTVQSKVGAAGG